MCLINWTTKKSAHNLGIIVQNDLRMAIFANDLSLCIQGLLTTMHIAAKAELDSFKELLHPELKISKFLCYSKIINTFPKNNVCVLKWIVKKKKKKKTLKC